MANNDDYRIKFVTEADTSGAKAQKEANAAVTDAAKQGANAQADAARKASEEEQRAAQEAAERKQRVARELAADLERIANEAAEAQKRAAREVAEVSEEATKEQIAEARELAKELMSLEEIRRRDARQLQHAIFGGGKLSQAGAWSEEVTRVWGDFGKGASQASQGASGLSSDLVALSAGAAGAVAVFTSLQTAVSATLAEFAGGELAVQKLEAALQTAGMKSDGYRDKLKDLADTLSGQVSNVGGEAWLEVLTQLTQAGAEASEIEELANGVRDLAGVMGGDVNAATGVFTRALRGNFEALRRYGFQVEENADQTEKMAELMRIAAQGAGILEARSNTLTGTTEQLGSAWGDLKKAIGTAIAPTAKSWMQGLTQAIQGVVSLFPKAKNSSEEFAVSQNKLRQSTDESTKALEKQRSVFAGLARNAEAVADAFERKRRAEDASRSREDQLTDARTERDLARIGALEKAGRLTPEKAAAASDIVRGRAEKEKFDRAQKAREAEIASRTRESAQLEKAAMEAGENARASGNEKDLEEAERLSELYIEKARENADRIEQLRQEIEHERQLFNLRQDARSAEARGEMHGARRKEREEAAKVAEKETKKGSKADDRLAGQRADALADSQDLAEDVGKLKGPSPESTARLQQAARSLEDGASVEELNGLNGVLDRLASALEKKGKGEEAQVLRNLQQKVERLEGVVRRLENQQGGSGS